MGDYKIKPMTSAALQFGRVQMSNCGRVYIRWLFHDLKYRVVTKHPSLDDRVTKDFVKIRDAQIYFRQEIRRIEKLDGQN